MRTWAGIIVALVVSLLACQRVSAHPALPTVASLRVDGDGGVELVVHHDALAFALNDTSARIGDEPMLELLGGPDGALEHALEAGRDRMISLLRVRADGVDVPLSLERWPTAEAVRSWVAATPRQPLPVKLEFVVRGRVPLGSRALTLRFPEVLGDLILTVETPEAEPLGLPLGAGRESPEIGVGSLSTPTGGGGDAARTPAVSGGTVLWRYVVLGFEHIIPEGPDHALFVLGLFLLSPRVRPVLGQITAFTVAHTVTLALTVLGLVSVPAWIVEPAIAASIVFVGVENLLVKRVHPWRPAVAFAFGLLHGMGFASALAEVGLPSGQLAAGLAGFAVGVECGHVVVLLAAAGLVGWARERSWYRAWVLVPGSLAVAAVAGWWFSQRVA